MDEGQKRRTGAILFIIGTVSFIQTGLYTIVWCIGVGIDFGLRFFPLAVELLQLFGYPIVGSLLLVVAVQILLDRSTIGDVSIVIIAGVGIAMGLFINIYWTICYSSGSLLDTLQLIIYAIIPLVFECGLPAVGAWLIYTTRAEGLTKT
jgi:hypothetical protein